MDEVRKLAEQVHNKLRSGYLDLPNHSIAKALVNEVENLMTDIKQQKHPLSIENRIKTIIKHLESLVDDIVMDFNHRDELIRHSMHMRQMVRELA